MANRFKVGDRVTVTKGAFCGARGHITQRAHEQVRPYLDWVVTFDSGSWDGREWAGFGEDELEPWTVPPEARPLSVGALQHPMREASATCVQSASSRFL